MTEKQKHKVSPLITLNNLRAADCGVFIRQDKESEGLSYSDGDVEEEYIRRAVSSASDLSSLSEELKGFVRDWASECHLSPKRANIYRALDFSGVEKVLEVGSGCGAITRFLGEHSGIVDAVEGSLRRAEITRLRCRGIDNITVVNADFNALDLPANYYDLVILTGVVEYAGKYASEGQTPEAATVGMLRRIVNCLSSKGSILIAIENRIGFKYMAGACEDHFSRPWVGVSHYPDGADPAYREKKGIRTWDRGQWQAILDRLQGIVCSWYYPFPDYKLATTLLTGEFIQNTQHAGSCLSRVHSRDYTATWHPAIDEQLFWQTAADANALEEMTNSFVLVLQRENATAWNDKLVPFDFVHFSGHQRKLEYRVKVLKKRGAHWVDKIPLFHDMKPDANAVVLQHIEREPFYEGQLLAVHWANVLRSCTSSETFTELLNEYYRYVVKECECCGASKYLDLLPMNIIVDDSGRWHSFDQEWCFQEDLSPHFILFRAFLYFYWDNKTILLSFCKRQHLNNGWEFVKYSLERLLYSGEFDIDEFVKTENKIQRDISSPGAFTPIETVLDSTPDNIPDAWSWKRTALVWGDDTVTVSSPVSSTPTEQGQLVVFSLPTHAGDSSYFQLSFGLGEKDIDSVFKIHTFTLYGHCSDGGRNRLFPVSTQQDSLPPLIKVTGVTFFENIRGGVFVVDEKEAQVIHFVFPVHCKTQKYTVFDCELVMEFLGSIGGQIRLEQSQHEKQTCVQQLEENRRLLEDRICHISQIEQSQAWQLVLFLRSLKKKIVGIFGSHSRGEVRKRIDVSGEVSEHDMSQSENKSLCGKTDEIQGELISVILAVYNTGADELRQTIDSVLLQSYQNWELIIIDSCSTDEVTIQALTGIKHPKIKIHFLKKSENLTQAMNEGLLLAKGQWITFLGHFDRFCPDAFGTVVRAIHCQESDMLYCDEEIIGRYGDVLAVKEKAEFFIDTMDKGDSINNCLFIRQLVARQAGGLDSGFDGVQLLDLALRATKYTNKVVHLSEVLYKTREFTPASQDEIRRNDSLIERAWEQRSL